MAKIIKKPAAAKKAAQAVAKSEVKPHPHAARQTLLEANPDLEHVAYRGAVPLKAFVGWVSLVVGVSLLVGVLAANLLVNQRLGQLVQETSTRVELQGQGRSNVVSEWLNGVEQLANGIENAEIVKLYVGDSTADAGMANAVMAQKPYMEQMLKEFVSKNGLLGAQIVKPGGQIVVSEGVVPEVISKNPAAVEEVIKSGKGVVRPLRVTPNGMVMDVLRPINAMAVNDAQAPVLAVLWFSLPVGDKLSELVAATPLDRSGERTALLQRTDGKAEVVGRTALANLHESYDMLASRLASGGEAVRVVQPSVVDGKPVFAVIKPVGDSPLVLLQEYSARDALGLMSLYKPGIYLIVSLLMVVLGALMLALTLHLMGQRNKTRVKLLGQTMEALVRVVEARDPYLGGHHSRVARLAVDVGNKLNLSVGERATLFYGAQLAAVGRLLVPRGVLAKKGKLSPAERKELEGHIDHAMRILGDLEFDLPIVPVISQMYEREDGTGHPLGLKAHQINRMGKVLGACDAFIAMISERAHRKAMTKGEALKSMGGGKFSDDVVGAIKKADKHH
jgi:hypothetical protein